jgi:hypothetical protein
MPTTYENPSQRSANESFTICLEYDKRHKFIILHSPIFEKPETRVLDPPFAPISYFRLPFVDGR